MMQIKELRVLNKNTNGYWKNFLVWNRILAFVFCLLTFPVVFFSFYKISSSGLWFFSLQYLTNEGNIIFWTFLLLYAFLDNRRIFNGNYFLICALAYITFVFIGFNVLLLPNMVKDAEFVTVENWISTVWYHMFSPILDITFGSIIFAKVKNTKPSYKVVGYGFIYIAYLFAYFCILPFAAGAIRYNNKVNNYNYLNQYVQNLNLSVSNKAVGCCTTRLPFISHSNVTGSNKSILEVANQILNNYSGEKKQALAKGMIQHWFTINGTSFVKLSSNGHLVVPPKITPNTMQLAQIYNNMGLNYDAIKDISPNGLYYFHDNVFSVYGTITNLNPNVNIYEINSINNKNTLNELYYNLTSSNFNPDVHNLYYDSQGSYWIFFVVFGAVLAYFIFLSFWWGMARVGFNRQLKKQKRG